MRRRTTTEQGYGGGWQRLRLVILWRDGYVCHWCGGRANSVDHVTPKVEGGGDEPGNLVAACTPCNSRRSMEWVRANRGWRGRAGTGSEADPFFCGAQVPTRSSALRGHKRARTAPTGVLAAMMGDDGPPGSGPR